MDELLARVRALLRRATVPSADEPSVVTTDSFTVDLAAHRVTTADGDVRLTPTEWHLLDVLVRHPGQLVTQRQLLQEVWGPAYGTETNYLRVYMSQLRHKLEADPARPKHLVTEPGVGYRFEPGSERRSADRRRQCQPQVAATGGDDRLQPEPGRHPTAARRPAPRRSRPARAARRTRPAPAAAPVARSALRSTRATSRSPSRNGST